LRPNTFDGQGAPLSPLRGILAKLFFQHLVFGLQVLEDFFLLSVNPTGQDKEQQLASLQKGLHISPNAV
jgi:hypothetical protein